MTAATAIDRSATVYRLYSLNEATLGRFVVDGLLRRPMVLLSVRPILGMMRGFLDHVAQWMIRGGRARHVVDLVPELKPYFAWHRRLYFREAFTRIEPWQDRFYRFEDTGACDDSLHMAFKAVTCQIVYNRAIDIYALDGLRRAFPDATFACSCVHADTLDMYRECLAEDPFPVTRQFSALRSLVNLLIAVLAVAWSLASILRRTRLKLSPTPVFCVLDVLGNRQERYVLDELRDGGTVLLMDRRVDSSGGEWRAEDHGLRCTWGEGRFSLTGSLRTLTETGRDILRLWRRHSVLHTEHFLQVVLLPLKRAKWRGLFNLYRPRHYLGRDEYNPEHILRTDELRRIEAKSHGWSGAIYSAFTRVAPNARYVDFDYYYVVGSRLYDMYRDKWPGDIKINSIGTFGYPRDRLELRWPRGNAILVALRIAFDEPEFARMVQLLARTFPERRIILQVKHWLFHDQKERAGLLHEIIGDFDNVEYVEANIYDLLEQAACLVSDISTLPGEAICLGVPTFVADLIDQEYCQFRDFPGLCVEDAEELVTRVGAALHDPESYPVAEYRRRMGLDGPPRVFDVLRRDMGLQPRETPVCRAQSA